jgi:hypothetical protein
MISYLGNSSVVINWQELIDSLEIQEPAYVGPSHSRKDNIPGVHDVLDKWDQAGYVLQADGGTAGWDMFLPNRNFDQKIVDKFADFIGATSYNSAWVSRVNPGMVVPYHWDVHDHEEELSTMGNFKRWHCHMSKPGFGHAFFADNKCFYNQEQGSVHEWDDRKLWHGGTNCGLVPKYIFNFW